MQRRRSFLEFSEKLRHTNGKVTRKNTPKGDLCYCYLDVIELINVFVPLAVEPR